MDITRSAFALALLLAAVFAGTADASTVKVVSTFTPPGPCSPKYGCPPSGPSSYAAFDAAPGEPNDVTVSTGPYSPSGRRTVTFRDDGAPLARGAGCTAQGDGAVVCGDVSTSAIVELGDGDDRAALVQADTVPSGVILRGGDGADRLTGADGPDAMFGGPGDDLLDGRGGIDALTGDDGADTLSGGDANDTLSPGAGDDTADGGGGDDQVTGGGGRDELRGGDGRDTLFDSDGAAPGPDVLDGGPGIDVATYSGRPQALTIDLADPAATDGAAGEGDTLIGIQNVTGGDGADVIRGDAGPNTLDGGLGRDSVDGAAGDDVLYAAGDQVTCGAGRDRTLMVSASLRVLPDCELLQADAIGLFARPVVRATYVTVKLPCFSLGDDERCTSTVSLGRKGALGAGTRRARDGGKARVVVRLTPAGRRAVAAGSPLAVTIVEDDGEERLTVRFTLAPSP